MSPELAAAVFGGISALSDAIHLYRTIRGKGKTPLAAEIEDRMQVAEGAARQKSRAVQALGSVIADDILDDIKDEIEKEKERLKDSMRDPANDNRAKDKAIDIANSNICAWLRRIKRLNGGTLPDPELERLWASHGCS